MDSMALAFAGMRELVGGPTVPKFLFADHIIGALRGVLHKRGLTVSAEVFNEAVTKIVAALPEAGFEVTDADRLNQKLVALGVTV